MTASRDTLASLDCNEAHALSKVHVANWFVTLKLNAKMTAGVLLRNQHGVAPVKYVATNKILRILKAKGLAPNLPLDLYHLIKKAFAIRKHLEKNR